MARALEDSIEAVYTYGGEFLPGDRYTSWIAKSRLRFQRLWAELARRSAALSCAATGASTPLCKSA
jgi:hypothetical protein